ncbi:hypothetical protein K2X30_04315 [bacterium]|nr:hypothetical protein [bacterium]
MAGPQTVHNVRRFKINPVELAIFAVVTMVFLNSVYNLFYDSQNLTKPVETEGSKETADATNPSTMSRSPATSALHSTFMNVEVSCEEKISKQVSANKIRILGQLCGDSPVKTSVINKSNQFNATVFTDVTSNKYSTDYIPLKTGENPIHIEFAFAGGKTLAQDLVLTKK